MKALHGLSVMRGSPRWSMDSPKKVSMIWEVCPGWRTILSLRFSTQLGSSADSKSIRDRPVRIHAEQITGPKEQVMRAPTWRHISWGGISQTKLTSPNLFRRRWKKTTKLGVTGLCEWNLKLSETVKSIWRSIWKIMWYSHAYSAIFINLHAVKTTRTHPK